MIASRSASVISTFLSASSLKRTKRAVQRVALHVDPHLLEGVGERVATRVLAEHDLRGFLTDRRSVDDLVGLPGRPTRPWLVNAGLVPRTALRPTTALLYCTW